MTDLLSEGTRVTVLGGPMHARGSKGSVIEVVNAAEVRVKFDLRYAPSERYRERVYHPSEIRPLTADELTFDREDQITYGRPPCEIDGCENISIHDIQVRLTRAISFRKAVCQECFDCFEERNGKRVTVKIVTL